MIPCDRVKCYQDEQMSNERSSHEDKHFLFFFTSPNTICTMTHHAKKQCLIIKQNFDDRST